MLRLLGLAALVLAIAAGCGPGGPARSPAPTASDRQIVPSLSDAGQVGGAEYSILFVGNSHTHMHDIPDLVGRMLRHGHPGRTVYTRAISVGFLEDAARSAACKEELETRPWKFVVLQAQKISMSGKYEYSRREGIDIALLAKSRGASVFFFSEWGLAGVKDDGAKQEGVYRQMAEAAGARVARVGRAWDIALAARPDLPVYDVDGNHESQTGAFLTACVLAGSITGESPAPLGAFDYAPVGEADRRFLAEAAAKALAEPVPAGK